MARRRLLVVVDYQRDLVEGPLGFDAARALEKPLGQALRGVVAEGGEAVVLMDTHEQKYLLTPEGRVRPVKHTIRGTPGWALSGKLDRFAPAAPLLEKAAPGGTALADYIRQKGPFAVIELCGIDSQGGVLAAAVIAQAAAPESEILVDRRLVAAHAVATEATFVLLKRLGVRVIDRD